ncbi:MAG: glycosyltransferase family 9 protein [Bacteroidota bacterium]|nr:glycosyltransferase family 9 protein [Bacteroidota bacterium]
MQKILVIQTAFTGDVVLATAVVEKLHQFYPEAEIDFVLRKGNEGLLNGHPFLKKVLIWNKKENKFRNLFDLLKIIRRKKYDKVINLQRFASTGFLTGFSQAKERIGFDKNPLSFLFTKKIPHLFKEGVHEVERNNKLIEYFTDGAFNKPKLYPTQKDADKISQYTHEHYVCMMPASVWFTKQYPEEKWVELIDHFPSEYHIYLLGGNDDAILCERIKEKTKNEKVKVVAGKLNFLSSAALMKGAKMNYSNDSAPLHFASATGSPITAIFCSTVPEFGFYPLSEKSIIMQSTLSLSCKPCTLHGQKACPLGHFKCAVTIETKKLLESLNA